jgi:hypothetical protein
MADNLTPDRYEWVLYLVTKVQPRRYDGQGRSASWSRAMGRRQIAARAGKVEPISRLD